MALPDAQYGENAAFQEIQSGASMAQGVSSGSAGGPSTPMPVFTGLGEPTQQPDTPVTDGAEYGAGGGPESLGLPEDVDKLDAAHLKKYLPTLIAIAERDETPPGMKMWVRSIIAKG